MSGDSSQEKTEEASHRKLEKAREHGQVARSTDLPSTLVLTVVIFYLWFTWDWTLQQLQEVFVLTPQLFAMDFHQALQAGLQTIIYQPMLTIALPLALVATLAGIIGNLIQFGFLFSFESITPNFSKISLSSGFQRMFSAKQAITTLLSLFKTLIIGGITVWVLYVGMRELLHAVEQCDVACQQHIIEYLLRQLVIFVLPVLVVMAVLDYLFQRSQFMKEQRMTKEEVKHEMKDSFGDPHVRGARDGMRRELAEHDIQQRIRTARLLVLDMGTAIALQYEQGVTPLPVIVAIGKGMMARKMVEIATKENVTLVTNPTLTQALIKEGKVDQYIPDSTINAVAQAMRQTTAKPKH